MRLKGYAYYLVAIILFVAKTTKGQQVIDVTEQTIKVGGLKEEEIYLGFAKGDKIIFNFQEVNNKELKAVEIIEYPSSSKFSDFKSSSIQNKTLSVSKQGVYIFRIKNTNVIGRICKIKIQRVPASNETVDFNTNVEWITKQDTTWSTYPRDILVGYDTVYTPKTRRELLKSEQREELISDKTQRVHSQTHGNKTAIFFTLPLNQTSTYETRQVISWAYWIGVGNEANLAWKSNAQTISNLAKGAATHFTTPLGALAIGAVTDLMIPKMGEDVGYAITDQQNKDLFLGGYQYRLFDQGKGIAGFKRFTEPALCQGTYYMCMYNDNLLQAIDVNVKVVAIVEIKTYMDVPYIDVAIKPRHEKKFFTEPSIRSYQVPITGQ
jgi:hypothetical protein